MRPRIVAAFDGVNMGKSHQGLAELAKLWHVKVDELNDGELILFLNTRRDKLKVLGSQGQVLAYVKLQDGRRLPLEAIQYIPKTFAAKGKLDLDAAITEHVKAALAKKGIPGETHYYGGE